jgi:vacuolar-type H+-ATPase subunit H
LAEVSTSKTAGPGAFRNIPFEGAADCLIFDSPLLLPQAGTAEGHKLAQSTPWSSQFQRFSCSCPKKWWTTLTACPVFWHDSTCFAQFYVCGAKKGYFLVCFVILVTAHTALHRFARLPPYYGAARNQMASESLLESVAQHENALMKDLDLAREEARQVVEAAHTASAALLQETNAQLDEEVAKRRREAAQAREEERASIQQTTDVKVEQIRTDSVNKTSTVRDELIARIIPSID